MSTDGHRRLLGSEFVGDDGSVDRDLADALAAHGRGGGETYRVLAALTGARLLVPVVAVATELETDGDGPARDAASEMAAVLLTGADGRLALLAFTSLESLAAWNPRARPVPVTARVAGQSALSEGAAALVLDLAGPTRFVVEGEDLAGLAAGWSLARVGERSAWIRPAPE